MDEAVGKKFLDLFPDLKRSGVMNQFLNAAKQAKSIQEILGIVHSDAAKRFNSKWADGEIRDIQSTILGHIDSADASNLAEYCLWWESLPFTERQRIKDERGVDFRAQAMATKPPSDKQLGYLERLGCDVVPKTMNEASKLIEQWKGKTA